MMLRFALRWDGRKAVVVSWESWRSRVAADDDEFFLPPGGMLVLSTDVNAEGMPGFKGKLVSIVKSLYQRVMKNWLVKDVMDPMFKQRGEDSGWSIGNLFRGRFFDSKTGNVYDEKSFAIDVRGVELDFLEKVAEKLGKKFKQRSVLLIDNGTGRGKFVQTGYTGKEARSLRVALGEPGEGDTTIARQLVGMARELVDEKIFDTT